MKQMILIVVMVMMIVALLGYAIYLDPRNAGIVGAAMMGKACFDDKIQG